MASFNEGDVERLLQDAGIVRHRGKIEAAINNARRAIELVDEHGSLAHFVWSFEPPPRGAELDRSGLLPVTPESRALARELKRRGWRFVGPTTVYAFMQSMGVVNDHLSGCHARSAAEAARMSFIRPRRQLSAPSGQRRPATSRCSTFSDVISISCARSRRMTASAIAIRPIATAPSAQAAIATGARADGPMSRAPEITTPVTAAPVSRMPARRLWLLVVSMRLLLTVGVPGQRMVADQRASCMLIHKRTVVKLTSKDERLPFHH